MIKRNVAILQSEARKQEAAIVALRDDLADVRALLQGAIGTTAVGGGR